MTIKIFDKTFPQNPVLGLDEAKRLGFTVDRHVYPWHAYKGPRFGATETRDCLTDLEHDLVAALEPLAVMARMEAERAERHAKVYRDSGKHGALASAQSCIADSWHRLFERAADALLLAGRDIRSVPSDFALIGPSDSLVGTRMDSADCGEDAPDDPSLPDGYR